MRNLKRPWTADEDARLRQLLEAGASLRLVAAKLKRTAGAVKSRSSGPEGATDNEGSPARWGPGRNRPLIKAKFNGGSAGFEPKSELCPFLPLPRASHSAPTSHRFYFDRAAPPS